MRRLVLIATLLGPGFSNADILIGIARNRLGEIAYMERHEIVADASGLNRSIKVEYSKPDGSVFATMTSEFSSSKTVPDTVFVDNRFGYKGTIRVVGSTVEFEKFKNDKSVAKKVIPYDETMVASQGFDNFIRMNFTKLAAQSLKFQFGVLESKAFYNLVGYKSSETESTIEYRIKPNNWLVRLFAKDLQVIYDAKTKRLKSFVGRSNLLDDAGNSQDVTITYEWVRRS